MNTYEVTCLIPVTYTLEGESVRSVERAALSKAHRDVAGYNKSGTPIVIRGTVELLPKGVDNVNTAL